MRTNRLYTAIAFISFLFLTSCGITKKYAKPELEHQQLFRAEQQYQDSLEALSTIPLEEFFADAQLERYINEALEKNYDMKIAMERLQIAGAMFKQSKRAFLPTLQGNASVARSKLSFTQGYGLIDNVTQYDLGLSTAWEADIWGKLSSAKRARLAGLLRAEGAKQAIQSALVANVANKYYQLIALDEQLKVLRETADNRRSYVSTMKKLKQANVVNGAAVVQSEANQYQAELGIPDVERQIRELENQLSVLLARNPGSIERSSYNDIKKQENFELSIGVPSQLLLNRPDVIQSELAFREAFENTNGARASFYPSFTITGAAGFSSFEFDELFRDNVSLFANVAGGLLQPIFNRGALKANLEVAKSEQQIAYYDFQQTLLEAGQEVSDALFAYQQANIKFEKRTKQLDALNKSVSYTKRLLEYNSQTNYTDVLTSEQNLLSAEMQGIMDVLERKVSVINLYRALGGGWKVTENE